MLSLSILSSNRDIIDLDATVFIQLGLFFLLFFLLRALVFKPLINLFEAREEAIDGVRQKAKAAQENARLQTESLAKQLGEVKAEAARERERLRGEGARLERELLTKVREETGRTLTAAKLRLDVEQKRARAELEKSVPNFSQQIASKLLGREISL